MTTIKMKCPNCGGYNWKYYKEYNGHGCGDCGFLFLDNEFTVVTGMRVSDFFDTSKQRVKKDDS